MIPSLRSRQVHLDFHTSEDIPGVGARFDKRHFQEVLRRGRVNSITVFAKCHHSWCYYPSRVGAMHPTLTMDLLDAQVEAAHEIGVRAPVYITVGWSARDAEEHPEWVVRDREGQQVVRIPPLSGKPDDPRPIVHWKFMCPGSGYGEHVHAIAREVCERYPALDGLFFDINFQPAACYCESCRAGMKAAGLQADVEEDARRFNREKWRRFCQASAAILREKHPEATIYFNGGASQYSVMYHDLPTHFELEDLPTTWGGYDKLPLRARYFGRSGRQYLGMTGKFHTMWGEFGGFKNPEALRYECAAMLAHGARCSVGDQAHPSGAMDPETYRIIGHAYAYVERIEDYCFDAEETTRLGVFMAGREYSDADEGMVRMLMENQLDFDVALPDDDLTARFDAVVLPDAVRLDAGLARRLTAFADAGGGILLTGESGLDPSGAGFALDVGARYLGGPRYENDYVLAGPELGEGLIASPVLFYKGGHRVQVADGAPLGRIYEPYFNRTFAHYCSHQNTPNQLEPAEHPAAVRKGRIVYLAHPVCSLYHAHGMKFHRDYFRAALGLVYPDPVLQVPLPSAGRARLVRQRARRRFALHLLYAPPLQRGRALVLEDMPPIHDVPVSARLAETVKRVYLAPEGREISFQQAAGRVTFRVPEVQCHRLVILEY